MGGGTFEISNLSPIFNSTSAIPQNNSTSLLRARTDASLGCQLGKDQQPVQEGTCLIGTLRVHRFMLKAKKSDNIRDFTMFDLARTRERTVTT